MSRAWKFKYGTQSFLLMAEESNRPSRTCPLGVQAALRDLRSLQRNNPFFLPAACALALIQTLHKNKTEPKNRLCLFWVETEALCCALPRFAALCAAPGVQVALRSRRSLHIGSSLLCLQFAHGFSSKLSAPKIKRTAETVRFCFWWRQLESNQ